MSINFSTLATSALGFTVALSWNNAIKNIIDSYFPDSGLHKAIIYAVSVTIFVVIIALIINISRKIVWNKDQSHKCGSRATLVELWEPPQFKSC